MRTLPLALLALALFLRAAVAQQPLSPSAGSVDYSATIGTTPVQIIPASPLQRIWQRIINAGTSTGPAIWCSRSLTTTLAPNVAGSYPIGPFGNGSNLPTAEEFQPPVFVPNTATWCVAASGTASVTAEAAPR